jgi:hypothetical protein
MHCSSPDCGALTIGPSDEQQSSVNIGEAAHIYGLTPGSARYDALVAASELSDITNGIWLCRNCHKTVDADEQRFPVEVLFTWRRVHEAGISRRLGRPNELVAEKLNEERLKPFKDASLRAQQIVLDRPNAWEYKLAAELLRTELGAVQERWRTLKSGLYFLKSRDVEVAELSAWWRTHLDDVLRIVAVLSKLVTTELPAAFGPPGTPGSDVGILQACRLIVAAGQNLLQCEEDLQFTRFPKDFEELKPVWSGVVGAQIDAMMALPTGLSKIFAVENPTGEHHIMVVFGLPEGFNEANDRAWQRCIRRHQGKNPDSLWDRMVGRAR